MEYEYIVAMVCCLIIGAAAYYLWSLRYIQRFEKTQELKVSVITREAELRVEKEKANLETEYKKSKTELEDRFYGQEKILNQRESELDQLCEQLVEKEDSFSKKERLLESTSRELNEFEQNIKETRDRYYSKLSQISKISPSEARELLLEETRRDCNLEIQNLRQDLLDRTKDEVSEESRRILLATMQRLVSKPIRDATATVVSLPDESMKGRIVGREGRNIRTFEHITGTTLMIDDSPDSVLVSSFDPVRREVARVALEALIVDGRINPSVIESSVEEAEKSVHAEIIRYGKDTLQLLNIKNVQKDVVLLLGKLHFILSNNQNALAHSEEVANICALIAAEIGLDTALAKRAGLLHDIGKAVSEAYEGSHAIVGANIIERNGEDKRIVNAVAAHHKEVPVESAYAVLVMVADALSAVRPGARTSSLDGLISRVNGIEKIAKREAGVRDAYALQAGREVRVIVEPSKIDEAQARSLALRIREQIEEELSYPGTIDVTVIREQRFNETAI